MAKRKRQFEIHESERVRVSVYVRQMQNNAIKYYRNGLFDTFDSYTFRNRNYNEINVNVIIARLCAKYYIFNAVPIYASDRNY